MNPGVTLTKCLEGLLMLSLLVSVGCAAPSKYQSTTVGLHCNISWDKTNDPKVTGYQISVIDQSKQAKKTVRFIPLGVRHLTQRI